MWPFKKSLRQRLQDRVDFEIKRAGENLQHALTEQSNRMVAQHEQVAAIESMPVARFHWTPVQDGFGRIIAIAWKNDPATAIRLLEEPGQGWA